MTGLLLFRPAPLVAGRVTTKQPGDKGTDVLRLRAPIPCFLNACSSLRIWRRSCLSSVGLLELNSTNRSQSRLS